MENIHVLIYLPALNEEKNIGKVLARLPKSLDKVSRISYLVVDDGSHDQTAKLAQEANAFVISHRDNLGVGAAFHTATDYALQEGIDILVCMDADGQFDSVEIPAMILPIIEKKADMVTGNRFHEGKPANMSWIKYWGNNIISNLVSYISENKFPDVSCGYRAYSREALLRLNLFGTFTYTHETILDLLYKGLKVMDHPIKVEYFKERRSRVAHNIGRYAFQTSKIIFRTLIDYKPMRVLGSFGGMFILIGVGFVLFLMGHYFVTGAFSPYKSYGFIGLGFFIFGMLVFLASLIADMLNRIRINQENILYRMKKNTYDGKPSKHE